MRCSANVSGQRLVLGTGKSWRDLPLRERMVALKRTSELQKTPMLPASGQTPQAGFDRNGISPAAETAGNFAVGPQERQQLPSGGLSAEQQQAHEQRSRADLASARMQVSSISPALGMLPLACPRRYMPMICHEQSRPTSAMMRKPNI